MFFLKFCLLGCIPTEKGQYSGKYKKSATLAYFHSFPNMKTKNGAAFHAAPKTTALRSRLFGGKSMDETHGCTGRRKTSVLTGSGTESWSRYSKEAKHIRMIFPEEWYFSCVIFWSRRHGRCFGCAILKGITQLKSVKFSICNHPRSGRSCSLQERDCGNIIRNETGISAPADISNQERREKE